MSDICSELLIWNFHSCSRIWDNMPLSFDLAVLKELFKLSQHMRLWYYHIGTSKGSDEPRQSLRCSHTWSMEVDEGSNQRSDIQPHWMAAHLHLKNEFMEDKKYHNYMSWLFQMRSVKLSTYLAISSWNSLNKASLGSSLILGLFLMFFALFAYLETVEIEKVSHVTRKPVFWVCNQVRLKPVCSASETC